MRCLTRMGLGLAGLALVPLAPTVVSADPPASGTAAPAMAPPLSVLVPAEVAQPRPRRTLSMFHKPHLCAQCQWEEARAKGINAPPPPLLPQGAVATPGNACERCGGPVGSTSAGLSVPIGMSVPAPPPSAAALAENCANCDGGNSAPGRAVAGGDAAGAGNAPGYVVVGGTIPTAEPMPIGVIQGRYAYPAPAGPAMPPTLAMNGGRPGRNARGAARGAAPTDPAVMPSSFKPTDPYLPNEHNRPHILRHLLGFDAIGQRGREDRERRQRENHAAISYQAQSSTVSDVPARLIYGR